MVERTKPTLQCPFCEYLWHPRKLEPKACPKCKNRLDSPYEMLEELE